MPKYTVDTYKVLGQVQGQGFGVNTELYQVPQDYYASVSHLSVINTGSVRQVYTLAAVKAVEVDSTGQTPAKVYIGAARVPVIDRIRTYPDDTITDPPSTLSSVYDTVALRKVRLSTDGTVMAVLSNDGQLNTTSQILARVVRVYDLDVETASWVLRSEFVSDSSSGSAPNYPDIMALSGDGNTVAYDRSQDGAQDIVVKKWNGTTWSTSYLTGESHLQNTTVRMLLLSGDGNKLAAGLPLLESNAGAVYTFQYDAETESWNMAGEAVLGPSPYSSIGDGDSGYPFLFDGKMSLDGTKMAVPGASSIVRVYQLDEWSQWTLLGSISSSSNICSFSDDLEVFVRYDYALPATGSIGIYRWNPATSTYDLAQTFITPSELLERNERYGLSTQNFYDYAAFWLGLPQLSDDAETIFVSYAGVELINGGISSYQNPDRTAAVLRLDAATNTYELSAVHDFDYEEGSPSIGTGGQWALVASGDGATAALYTVEGVDAGIMTYYYQPPASGQQLQNKHIFVATKGINPGEHHDFSGGICLEAGDTLYISSPETVIATLYGAEIVNDSPTDPPSGDRNLARQNIKYKILGQNYQGITEIIVPGSGSSYYYYGGGFGVEYDESVEPVCIYQVPEHTQAIVSAVFTANHDGVFDRTYDMAVVPAGETLSRQHHVRWDYSVRASDFDMFSGKLTLSAGDCIYVLPSTVDKIGFTVFGTEIPLQRSNQNS